MAMSFVLAARSEREGSTGDSAVASFTRRSGIKNKKLAQAASEHGLRSLGPKSFPTLTQLGLAGRSGAAARVGAKHQVDEAAATVARFKGSCGA